MRFGELFGFLMENGFGNHWIPWSVDQLSDRLGVASSTIYLWKSGRRSHPRSENLRNIVEIFRLNRFFRTLLHRSIEGVDVNMNELMWRRDCLRYGDVALDECFFNVGSDDVTQYKASWRPIIEAERVRSSLDVSHTTPEIDGALVVEYYGAMLRDALPDHLLTVLLSELAEVQCSRARNAARPAFMADYQSVLAGLVALLLMETRRYPPALKWWQAADELASQSYQPFSRVWVSSQFAREQVGAFRARQKGLPGFVGLYMLTPDPGEGRMEWRPWRRHAAVTHRQR